MSSEKKLQCLLCGREIHYGDYGITDGLDLIDDAGLMQIYFGYGSAYDNDSAVALICDKCFKDPGVRARLYSHFNYAEEQEKSYQYYLENPLPRPDGLVDFSSL